MVLTLLLACAGTGSDDTGTPAIIPIGDPRYERDPALDVDLESTPGATISHNAGQSCQSCHQAHGPGRGLFTVAGTAYEADGTLASAGSIRLWDGGPGVGNEVGVVPIDAYGNFYTTADMGYPDANLFPTVHDSEGTLVNAMPWPTTSGACNHCHTPVKRVAFP
ncbi:MAG: hypothetical protein V4850_11965 [Myxococcota bacterium]